MSFDTLGLAPELLRAVADEGYTDPTPVQREMIPLVLAGRDVLASAQTGTGKTAAFVLPLLQRLHAVDQVGHNGSQQPHGRSGRTAGQRVRALVLTPTRELALQVEASIRVYGRHRPVRSVAIYGGVPFDRQVAALRSGAAIVVATPGRLLDHVGQRTIDLSTVELFVLDEADRMLDMGFIHDIRKVLALLPTARQSLMLSATFSREIRSLAEGLLDNAATVQVAQANASGELVRHTVIAVDRHRKKELLTHLVGTGRLEQALVFVRTKHGANKLAEQLERDGIRATAIHGNKNQRQRVRALNDFKTGRVGILVATDIAARGIDIDALPHVVNFELPTVPADYVHRIGRTGRAGVEGHALSLVGPDETSNLRAVERFLGRPLPTEVVAGFEPGSPARGLPPLHRSPGERQMPVHASPPPYAHRTRPATPPHARTAGRRPGPMAWDDPRRTASREGRVRRNSETSPARWRNR